MKSVLKTFNMFLLSIIIMMMIVTIYSLKEYTSTLASQHSILKDQADIIKEFKNYVKQIINNDDIDIEM